MVYSLGASPTAHYPCRRQSLWLSLFCWRTVIRNPVCGEAIEFSYLGIHFVGISDETQVNINSIEKFSHKPLHLRKTQFTKVHHMLERYHRCQKKNWFSFFRFHKKCILQIFLVKLEQLLLISEQIFVWTAEGGVTAWDGLMVRSSFLASRFLSFLSWVLSGRKKIS